MCGAYFELHAVALLFAGRAGLPVDLFLWTEEQMQEERERAATAAQEAAGHVAALRGKVEEMGARVDPAAACLAADEMLSRDGPWALRQPGVREALEAANLWKPMGSPASASASASTTNAAAAEGTGGVGGGSAQGEGAAVIKPLSGDALVAAQVQIFAYQ